jgi:hypothetical protein
MTENILPGSRWKGGDDYFQVIQTVLVEGHTWVHYRRERDCLEFSCWTDSFLSRFTVTPQDSRASSPFGHLL